MYKIPDEVIQFIEKTMDTWRVELTAGGKSLAAVKNQRDLSQRDPIYPTPPLGQDMTQGQFLSGV